MIQLWSDDDAEIPKSKKTNGKQVLLPLLNYYYEEDTVVGIPIRYSILNNTVRTKGTTRKTLLRKRRFIS